MATKLINIDDKKYTLKELSEKYHINVKTLEFRYSKGTRGKDIVRPVEHRKTIEFKGEQVDFYQLSKRYGLSVSVLRNRYYKQGNRDDVLVRPKGSVPPKKRKTKETIYDALYQNPDVAPILDKVKAKKQLTSDERAAYWRAYRREYGRLYRKRNKKTMPEYWRKYYHNHNKPKRHEKAYRKDDQWLTRHAEYFNNYYYKNQANRDKVNEAVKNYRKSHPEKVREWTHRYASKH